MRAGSPVARGHGAMTAEHRLDLDAIDRRARRVGRGARVLLCSPHNPTGTVHTADELRAVAAIARARGADGRRRRDPRAARARGRGASRRTSSVSRHGLRRDLGVEGLQHRRPQGRRHRSPGAAIGGRWSRGCPSRCATARASSGASRTRRRGTAATTGSTRSTPTSGRTSAYLADLLARACCRGAHLVVPEATYLAWIDCRDLGLGDDPAAAFLERGRVALNSGPPFGLGGDGPRAPQPRGRRAPCSPRRCTAWLPRSPDPAPTHRAAGHRREAR